MEHIFNAGYKVSLKRAVPQINTGGKVKNLFLIGWQQAVEFTLVIFCLIYSVKYPYSRPEQYVAALLKLSVAASAYVEYYPVFGKVIFFDVFYAAKQRLYPAFFHSSVQVKLCRVYRF